MPSALFFPNDARRTPWILDPSIPSRNDISGWLLLRNGALLMLALPHEPEGGPPDLLHWALVATLVVLLMIFYLIFEQLLANDARLREG